MGYRNYLSSIISSRIIGLREMKGINKTELAKHIGVSPSFISKFESGKKNMSDEQMDTLLRFFNISEEQLIFGELAHVETELSEDMAMILNRMNKIPDAEERILEDILAIYLEDGVELRFKLLTHLKKALEENKTPSIRATKLHKRIIELFNSNEFSADHLKSINAVLDSRYQHYYPTQADHQEYYNTNSQCKNWEKSKDSCEVNSCLDNQDISSLCKIK